MALQHHSVVGHLGLGGGQVVQSAVDVSCIIRIAQTIQTANSELDTIGVWSSFGGLQHFWTEKFRSNLTYGHVSADNPASMPNDALDSTTYASANLIWNPIKQLTLGAEYLWGRRENVDGASGTSNRLLFSSQFVF